MALINQLKRGSFVNGMIFQAQFNDRLVTLKYEAVENESYCGHIIRYPRFSSKEQVDEYYCTVEMICLNHFKWVAPGPFGTIIKGRTYFNQCICIKSEEDVPAAEV